MCFCLLFKSVATRILEITPVACVAFLLDSAALERHVLRAGILFVSRTVPRTQNNVRHWRCWAKLAWIFTPPKPPAPPRPAAATHLSAHVWGNAPSLQRTAAGGHDLHPGCGPGSGQTVARPWCWDSSCASGWRAPPSSGTWKLYSGSRDSFVSALNGVPGEEARRRTVKGRPVSRSALSTYARINWSSQPTGP